jgi:YVTN family beta-propeller protein
MALTPSGATLYVTGESIDSNGNALGIVAAIDTATDAVTATIPVGQSPQGIAVSPIGTDAYVANFDSNTVSVLDTSTNTVTDTIQTGLGPASVAFNTAGTLAYIVNLNNTNLVTLDTGTRTITTTTPAPIYPNMVVVSRAAQPTTTTLTLTPAGPVPAGSPVTLSAAITPTATAGSVQFYDGTIPLGAPVSVNAGAGALTTSSLIPGAHSLAAAFTPAAGTSLPSTSAPATLQVNPAPGIAIDQAITKTGTGSVTTAPLSTNGSRLLVAYVASDGPATKQSAAVTGAGLTLTLAARANKAGTGTAEIWTATAPAALTCATITSTPKAGGYDQSLTVVAYTGASGIGATATASKTATAPSATLTTTKADAWIFGVGEDYTSATARTLGPGQNLISQWVDSGPGETFWVQNRATTTPSAGTAVTLNDTAPTSSTWNLAIAEITPSTP